MVGDGMLLRSYVKGDESAFRALVERHAGMVWGVGTRMLGEVSKAEELCKRVFKKLARNAEELAGDVVLCCWLHEEAVSCARELRDADLAEGRSRRTVRIARARHEAAGSRRVAAVG